MHEMSKNKLVNVNIHIEIEYKNWHTYPHLLKRLGQNITTFLLVNKDNNWWVKSFLQDVEQLLPKIRKT